MNVPRSPTIPFGVPPTDADPGVDVFGFASRVLTGVSWDDKLAPPLPGVDRAVRGPVPAVPGRPPGLAPSDRRARFTAAIDTPRGRGEVLHFFANHELLALELMALALLKFPDAPPSFRRGLVGVMRDEQRHLAGYLARLAAVGVTPGELPLSDFFWTCLAPVDDPIVFVAGVALGFEQANLDFAGHYARAFRAVGDVDTADVLDQVLADEVRHVAHGLQWFDRWRGPGDRFDAWCARLPPPLTPARARGIRLDRAPRRAAGLDDDFIDRVAAFGASKGRPPTIAWMNPDAEASAAVGRPVPPTRGGRAVAHDLGALMMFLHGADDVVCCPAPPTARFLAGLAADGVAIPRFVADLAEVADLPRSGLAPWAWSPDARRFAASLAEVAPVVPPEVFGKAWAAPFSGAVGCATTAEVEAALGESNLIKASFSTSGRARRRTGRALTAEDHAWLANTLAVAPVVVEPHHERVLDLSVQLMVGDERVRVDGFGRFETDAHGRWLGARLGPWAHGLSRELQRFVHDDGRRPGWVEAELAAVAARVGAALRAAGHRGPAGIDAYVHRVDGELRLRPCVEVNPRVTLGRIALALGRFAPGRTGWFGLVAKDEAPPSTLVVRDGRWEGGQRCVTDPAVAAAKVAVVSLDGPGRS